MDIVERLRELANGGYDAEVIDRSKDMMEVAADEIERLRLHKDVLLEALQRIANEEDGLNVWSYAESMVDEFTEKPTAEGE